VDGVGFLDENDGDGDEECNEEGEIEDAVKYEVPPY
jgi:hypothetical protein